MNNHESLLKVQEIESKFADNLESFDTFNQKKIIKKRGLRVEHIYWIPSLLFGRIYKLFPKVLKDIFFWLSIIHKSPTTKFFARTNYDKLRTLLDIKISSLCLKAVPEIYLNEVTNTFRSGCYTTNLPQISFIDELLEGVLTYAKPSHAGARPYFKDGKNKELEGSFSAYYTFSINDNHKMNGFLGKCLNEEFNHHLSALAGYKCSYKDLTYSLGIVFGENSNSEMHQDTYASVAKGFIYLQDVGKGNSPFEYLEGSYTDAAFRSEQTNEAVLNNDFHSSGSTRLRGKILEEAICNYGMKTFTGSKGLFVLANTAGYHRKGAHNSNLPRITLACGVKRKGLLTKLIVNVYAIFKNKIYKSQV